MAPISSFQSTSGAIRVTCPIASTRVIHSRGSRGVISVGEPTGLSVMELIARCKTKFNRGIAPVMVDGLDAPVNANHRFGDDVDVTIFPSARHWAGDGGRYIGTADAIITRDPDEG